MICASIRKFVAFIVSMNVAEVVQVSFYNVTGSPSANLEQVILPRSRLVPVLRLGHGAGEEVGSL